MIPVNGRLESITIDGVALATRTWDVAAAAAAPTVVLLHEGLGSIGQWRDLPERIHQESGLPVMAYDRGGHGLSGPSPLSYDSSFMHHEAQVVLPGLLARLRIERPVLIGHSDGASIALIAAGSRSVNVAGLGLIAPHLFVEPICLDGIRRIASNRDQIVSGLARHHDNPGLVFDRWRDVWLSPEFATWDIREILAGITCPLVAAQGDHDEYATNEMIEGILRLVPHADGRFLPDCGHVAHRDQPDLVLELVLDTVHRTTMRP